CDRQTGTLNTSVQAEHVRNPRIIGPLDEAHGALLERLDVGGGVEGDAIWSREQVFAGGFRKLGAQVRQMPAQRRAWILGLSEDQLCQFSTRARALKSNADEQGQRF